MDIEQLATKARNGDESALSKIFNDYYNKIYYFALNHVKSAQDAEDIVQNTFIEVFKSIKSLSEPKALKSWIYLITQRQIIAFYRKSGRIPQTVDEDFDEATEVVEDDHEFLPENVFESEAVKNSVMEIILSLSEVQKTAILLYYYEEMSVREIAEVQSCSEGTVKSRLNYARNYIKSKIEENRKKGTSLIAVAPLPLLTRLLRELAEQNTMSPETASGILSNVGNATSITVSGTAATTATKTGIPLLTKLIAGIAAAAVVTTGIIVGVILLSKPDDANIGGLVAVTTNSPAQTLNTYTPTPMPVTESDYAKIYYQYIQDVLIPSGNFIDADMFDWDGDGNPEMVTSENYDGEVVVRIYCMRDMGSAKVFLSYTQYVNNVENEPITKELWFIGEYKGTKALFMYRIQSNTHANGTDEQHSIDYSVSNNNGISSFVAGWSFSASGYYSFYNADDADLGYVRMEYENCIASLNTWLKPRSSWGAGILNDPPFPIENTNGERLKNYFSD